jgi:hypothetical protein
MCEVLSFSFKALLVCLTVRCQLRSNQVLAFKVIIGRVKGVRVDSFRGKRELLSYKVEELVTRQHE